MREIKFRAWHEYGESVRPPKPGMIYDDKPGDCLTWLNQHQKITSIMQFTGLKDRDGKDIYEGDLVRCPVDINTDYHGEWCINEVICQHGQWIVSHISSEKGKLPRGYTRGFLLDSWFDFDSKLFLWGEDYVPRSDIEVIGNIYENPELLEDHEPKCKKQ